MMNRRQFLLSSTAAAGVAGLAGVPIMAPARAADGFTEIRAMRAKAPLLGPDSPMTDVWSYNGVVPGPVVRAARGETIRVRLINELDDPTTIHWHGIRIDNAMDGVAGLTQEPVKPGDSFDYVFTAPDAGTYWYHSHNKSWEQMARGLYGRLIVEGDAEGFATDHILMIDDWRLGDGGAIDERSMGSMMDWSHGGRLGNWVTVNGTSYPELELTAGAANRLRLVNPSNARIYELEFKGLEAQLIGLDGQVFDRPRPLDGPLVLSPAQRADLMVTTGSEGEAELLALNGSDRVGLAGFRFMRGDGGNGPALLLKPNTLPEPDLDDALGVRLDMQGGAMGMMQGARMGRGDMSGGGMMGSGMMGGGMMGMRDLVQNGFAWAFNGVAGMPDKPLFAAPRGKSVRLTMVNDTRWPHAMHLHGHHFRVYSRNGRPEAQTPWRDTVLTNAGETVEIGFVADNSGKWLIHCHMAEHMAAGMVSWFDVA
ncbi:MAG TPA: multicopper oxidase family protein [Afifellaceae bacterium]|nr:multicopper oxidase family protein [Afifellaceae bacterium]